MQSYEFFLKLTNKFSNEGFTPKFRYLCGKYLTKPFLLIHSIKISRNIFDFTNFCNALLTFVIMKIGFLKYIVLPAAAIAGAFVVSAKEPAERTELPPVMGWSSWNTYYVDINDSLIRRQADAMVSTGLKKAGYSYINIDDGFFGGRGEDGVMTYNKRKFPNGMRPVSDYIHSLGLKAGIYSDAGDNTCGSMYNDDRLGIGSGVYGYEDIDMNTYLSDWNFDFIKLDYCGAKELGLDEKERYARIVEGIRKTGRDDVSINICRWAFPGVWAKDLARSWRISPDINVNYKTIKSIIFKNLYLSAFAGPGHYNDMDMLEVGRGLTDNEDKLHFGLWCIMSSPLLIGCDMTSIKPETLELLKNPELIALNQDPLGLQASPVWRDGDCFVLAKDIEKLNGNRRAVAFVNLSDSTYRFRLPTSYIGLRGSLKMRDLTERQDLPTVEDEFDYLVPAHSALICSVKGEGKCEIPVYEAENAYLNDYDDLGHNPYLIRQQVNKGCSGGMMVHNLGGSASNYALWDNVWSEGGGEYELEISYLSPTARNMDVEVNGVRHTLRHIQPTADDKPGKIALRVKLNPGRNEIRMNTLYARSPDIDCFRLVRK